ncbi:MAG: hypothetical protein IPM98_13365 [Lewinellaceae bacterium]|nr:hypothetical protein [Lewinellaceae bacterium]
MVEQIDSEHYDEWLANNATNKLEKRSAVSKAGTDQNLVPHRGFLDREAHPDPLQK